MLDFESITYLKEGTQRQQLAYQELVDLEIMNVLKHYHPILVGTIPIHIDLPISDLDIICTCKNYFVFIKTIKEHYQTQKGFKIKISDDGASIVANFQGKHFEIEIFGQMKPTKEQDAYRHLLIEHRILEYYGEDFRQKIIRLKKEGMKTEPAFAQILQLLGDPYQALLNINLSELLI